MNYLNKVKQVAGFLTSDGKFFNSCTAACKYEKEKAFYECVSRATHYFCGERHVNKGELYKILIKEGFINEV